VNGKNRSRKPRQGYSLGLIFMHNVDICSFDEIPCC
jgi:hypothetical protein